MADKTPLDVVMHTSGAVTSNERAYAADKVVAVAELAPGPVLFAKVDLVAHADPARERPAFAKAEIDVDGRFARAHASGTSMFEAIDLLQSRLRTRMERDAHVQEAKHLRHREEEHSWHHGDPPTHRDPNFPRPVEDREIVRRKTFAIGEQTPDEAILDLEQLDHDFYLFRNIDAGTDNVVHRVGEGRYELLAPSPATPPSDTASDVTASPVHPSVMTLDDALALLNLSDLAFVFFLDPDTDRGSVLYHRRDGQYGLIEAS